MPDNATTSTNAEAQRRYRERYPEKIAARAAERHKKACENPPDVPADKHGTRVGYNYYHCRCEECRAAIRLYYREHMKDPDVREKRKDDYRRYRERHPERVRAVSAAWKARNPEKAKEGQDRRMERFRLKKYGLTTEEYAAMLAAQGGTCAICHSPDSRRLSADHDHLTGRVRGLLCRRCNLGLGCFGDDTTLLTKATAYLQIDH